MLLQVGLVVMPFSATYEGMEQAWVFGEVWCEVNTLIIMILMIVLIVMLLTIIVLFSFWSLLGLAFSRRFGLYSLNFASLCYLP